MSKDKVNLRKVNDADVDLTFAWVNDKEVRANSISTKLIERGEHEKWFMKKLSSSNFFLFIMEVDCFPAGQIRFEYNETEASWEIGYLLAPEFRGKGLSAILVSRGITAFNKFPLLAYVRPENKKSIRVFESLNFYNEGLSQVHNVHLIKFKKYEIDK
jgi:RimJ/RimL family protein N-acetyltransferase